jgi:hypothetical protein
MVVSGYHLRNSETSERKFEGESDCGTKYIIVFSKLKFFLLQPYCKSSEILWQCL